MVNSSFDELFFYRTIDRNDESIREEMYILPLLLSDRVPAMVYNLRGYSLLQILEKGAEQEEKI